MAKNQELELAIKIGGKVDPSLTKALSGATSQVSNFSTSLNRIAKVTAAVVIGVTTAVAAGIENCTEKAAEFETMMADPAKYVKGLADDNGNISNAVYEDDGRGKTYAENYAELAENLKVLSTQIPLTSEELAQMAAAAGQSGKTFADLIETGASGNTFLKDVAEMSTALEISADLAGDYATKWENIFGMTHEEVMELADQINYLGANSATTAAEIASVVNSSGGMGQVAGLTPATTAALADALLAMGIEDSTAATSLRRIVTNMTLGEKATKAQKTTWEELGFTATGVASSMQTDSEGTLLKVFEAINSLDKDKQTGVLKTLFGQWAIEGAAKISGNLDVLINAFDMIEDADSYTGSMQREFNIKSSTPEAIKTMKENALLNLQVDFGNAFLPIQKEWNLLFIDLFETVRANLPNLTQIAESVIPLMRSGVESIGNAIVNAMPYIQKAIDYVTNNGPEVLSMLKKVAAVWAAMFLAPKIESTIKTVSSLGSFLLGSGSTSGVVKNVSNLLGIGGTSKKSGTSSTGSTGILGAAVNLFKSGQKTGSGVANMLSATAEASSGNGGILKTAGSMVKSLLLGNSISTTTELMQNAASNPGLLSALPSLSSTISSLPLVSSAKNYASSIGSRFSNVTSALGNLGSSAVSGASSLLGKADSWFMNNTDLGQTIAVDAIINSHKNGGTGLGTAHPTLLQALPATKAGQTVKSIVSAPGKLFSSIKTNGSSLITSGLNAVKTSKFGVGDLSKLPSNMTSALTTAASTAAANGGSPFSMIGTVLGAIPKTLFGSQGLNLGGNLAAGIGTLANIWTPILSGFASIVAGAAPVLAVIGSVIAIFSILGDHFEDIRGFIGDTFGDKALAIFDKFTGGVQNIANKIVSFFSSENLAGIQETITNLFGSEAGAAFGGFIVILESVKDVIGQIVQWSLNYVKPIILEIFNFIAKTVLPKILTLFANAAPFIADILSGLGSGVMGVMTLITQAIQLALPVVEWLIARFIDVATVVIPAVLAGASVFATGIQAIVEDVQKIFNGIIEFFTGVFTGNWKKAWQGIKDVFGGIFKGIVDLAKTPINAVISVFNTLIDGINGLKIEFPDWMPFGLGGNSFSINIKPLDLLANGGFTNGVSIAGEKGVEAVISFLPGVRGQNIENWITAGQMLGVNGTQAAKAAGVQNVRYFANGGFTEAVSNRYTELRSLYETSTSESESKPQFVLAPNINISGNADAETIRKVVQEALEAAMQEFERRFDAMYERMMKERKRKGYA
jgi:TP901 family phage tail tape measure protein